MEHTHNIQDNIELANLEQQIWETLGNLKDTHNKDDQEWFHKLLEYNKLGQNPHEIQAGILLNITILDSITAKLLAIDPIIVVKAKVIKDYITQLWTDNNGNLEAINQYIITDKQQLALLKSHVRPTTTDPNTEPHIASDIQQPQESGQYHQQQTLQTSILLEEMENNTSPIQGMDVIQTVEEVIMKDRDTEDINEILIEKHLHLELASTVLGTDISKDTCYSTRNRRGSATNPYFIHNKGTFTAGALMANVPGNNKEEQ
jgi:hypothetical protein